MNISEIKERLEYNPTSGIFTWKKARIGMRAGDIAGSINDHGYVTIKFNGSAIKGHRLAWWFSNGSLPSGIVDHINGVRNDNRIENLRIVTASQNRINAGPRVDNKSGIKGVHWSSRQGRWAAQIHVDGKRKGLGYFADIEDAKKAYLEQAKKHHGEFARSEI